MSYLPPNPAILPDGQEVKVHGSEAFPFAVYCGIIPTFIPAYPLHYHEEMELIYCEAGSGSITIDRATVTLHTGDVAVILPGQIHAIAAAEAGTFRYYNILFRFSLLAFAVNGCFGSIVAWQDAGCQPPPEEMAAITWQAIRAVKVLL